MTTRSCYGVYENLLLIDILQQKINCKHTTRLRSANKFSPLPGVRENAIFPMLMMLCLLSDCIQPSIFLSRLVFYFHQFYLTVYISIYFTVY